ESLARPLGRLVPPVHLRWRYYGTARPAAFAGYAAAAAVELAARGLEPDHRVLDVGCGLGPLAVGLAPYLAAGRYDGFDVHAESARGVDAGTSFLPFLHPHGAEGSRVIDPANPERAIAHPEDAVRSWCAAAGLRVEGPVRYGGWWDGTAHGQDVLTAVKG